MYNLLLLLSLIISTPYANSASISGPLMEEDKTFHLNLSSLKTGAVIIFLSSSCPCSDAHIAHLKSLPEKYKSFQFLGIHSNADEKREEAMIYFKNQKLPFPVISDQKSHLADYFKALKTPHAFIINPEGKILYQGGVSSSSHPGKDARYYLEDAIKKITAGQKVDLEQTRVLGCEISRE